MLDLGTGSGILAIAAVRLGYAPVHALDLDPDAIRVARENARLNCVFAQIRFFERSVLKLRRKHGPKFSVVCANLISNLLIEQRERIISCVEEGGVLVLAGILKNEFTTVAHAYRAAGMQLRRSQAGGEWKSGTFEKRKETKKFE